MDGLTLRLSPETPGQIMKQCCNKPDLRMVQWDWHLICYECGARRRPQDMRKRNMRLRLSERSRRRESQIMYRIGRFGETWISNDGKLRIKRKVTARTNPMILGGKPQD